MINWKNIFKKEKATIYDEDSSRIARSMVIYNSENNFVILFEFSSELFRDAIEIANSYKRKLAVLYSCLETEHEEKEPKTELPLIVVQRRYYLLISGNDREYQQLFEILPMSNVFVAAIAKEIYASRSSSYYSQLIQHKVLDEQQFKHQGVAPKYDEMVKIDEDNLVDDIDKIMAKVPASFSAYDMLKVITVVTYGVDWSLFEFIEYYKDPLSFPFEADRSEKMLKPFIPSIEKIFKCKVELKEIVDNVLKPIYLRHETDHEFDYGPDKSADEMDDLFRQEYDRYNPFEKDQDVVYKDIDEQVSDTASST